MNIINFLVENLAIITALFSGGIGWFFGGRQKQDIDIKKSNTDAVKAMSDLYGDFLEDYKARIAEFVKEMSDIKAHNNDLQKQFNDIFLQLAKETEKSLNWEKLHAELAKKFNELQKEHDSLKKAFDNLKKLMK
jgi:septal ring factor EnvC (AmiA/AmiB activator)